MAALQDTGGVMRRDGTCKCCASQVLLFEDVRREGVFQIVTVLTHGLSSIRGRPDRPTDAEIILSRILEKAIHRSDALDTKLMCIMQASNALRFTPTYPLSTTTADSLTLHALQLWPHYNTSGGPTCWSKERKRPSSATVRASRAHCCSYTSRFVTFSYFAGGGMFLVDVSLLEEQVRQGEAIITMNGHGEIAR
ncbi:hypothetical protein BKA63DRAFT_486868 [Paraphoma chrysanthemicola]|nr:hypothetical protein BKA63DRAFT_486868 [Paraphoma chrysanthemicola]